MWIRYVICRRRIFSARDVVTGLFWRPPGGYSGTGSSTPHDASSRLHNLGKKIREEFRHQQRNKGEYFLSWSRPSSNQLLCFFYQRCPLTFAICCRDCCIMSLPLPGCLIFLCLIFLPVGIDSIGGACPLRVELLTYTAAAENLLLIVMPLLSSLLRRHCCTLRRHHARLNRRTEMV